MEVDILRTIKTDKTDTSLWVESHDGRLVHIHFLDTTIITAWDFNDNQKTIDFSCKKKHKILKSTF